MNPLLQNFTGRCRGPRVPEAAPYRRSLPESEALLLSPPAYGRTGPELRSRVGSLGCSLDYSYSMAAHGGKVKTLGALVTLVNTADLGALG